MTKIMILIADGGSTQTNWCFLEHGKEPEFFVTRGINPLFSSSEKIVEEWRETRLASLPGEVKQIYFYGAGIVNEEVAGVIKKALADFFPGAEMEAHSDLLAAAHATLGKVSGIACILGTGSNSCFYDGEKIIQHVPPLGFILGDEGSGAVLGKMLVGDYLKKTMPPELIQKFQERYPISYFGFLDGVYRQDKPNRFLAGFVPFLKENIEHEYCRKLVENAFDLFIKRNVAQYAGYENYSVNFVGSVAHYFEDQLKAVFLQHNLILGVIVKEPLIKLVEYHSQL
ncbi:MAG: ATPase [Mariniphaga sp.]